MNSSNTYIYIIKSSTYDKVKKKNISILEIAKKLQVSPTTISFVLNGKAKEQRVSDKVANKILAYVQKIGYKPNTFAQGLRTGKSKIIGLMIEDISNPFFANVARLIEDKAYENGYKIMYCSTHNDSEKAKDLIKMFKDCRVDGYIIAATDGIESEVEKLIADKEKVVLFDRYFEKIPTDYVVVNNEESCFNATSHLVHNGFKNIAFITTDTKQLQMLDRLKGYKKAIKKFGLNPLVKKIHYTQENEIINGEMETFLKANQNIDAILFATNYLGVNGIQVITKIGLKIPNDVAVVAFDDHVLFQLYNPPISAIAQPIELISESVINALLRKLNHGEKSQIKVEIPTIFLQRRSSQKK
jgi:LacI family transcriptional regulator